MASQRNALLSLPLHARTMLARDAIHQHCVVSGSVVGVKDLKNAEKKDVGVGAPSSSVPATVCYEVLRVKNGKFVFPEAHFERLRKSALATLVPPASKALTQEELSAVAAYAAECVHRGFELVRTSNGSINNNVKGLLYWVTTPPSSRSSIPSSLFTPKDLDVSAFFRVYLGYCAFYITSSYPSRSDYDNGVRFSVLYNAERVNPQAKTLQNALRSRAVAVQQRSRALEVLMCRGDGLLPEGSRSNYIIVRGGELLSSLDEDALCGVTASTLFRLCEKEGITVRRKKLYLEDVVGDGRSKLGCEAMAMLGTSVGVLPVREVDLQQWEENASGSAPVSVPSAAAGRVVYAMQSAQHPIIQTLSALYEANLSASLQSHI